MNLVDGQGVPGEIERNEAEDCKKEKKGDRMGKGRKERKTWEWGNEGLLGDPSLFFDDITKWRDVIGPISIIGIHAILSILCVVFLPLDLMGSP